jgi:hypothetical protein
VVKSHGLNKKSRLGLGVEVSQGGAVRGSSPVGDEAPRGQFQTLAGRGKGVSNPEPARPRVGGGERTARGSKQ